MLLKLFLEPLERGNDSFEGGGDVGKVSDSTANNQHLSVGMLFFRHQRQNRLRVLVPKIK